MEGAGKKRRGWISFILEKLIFSVRIQTFTLHFKTADFNNLKAVISGIAQQRNLIGDMIQNGWQFIKKGNAESRIVNNFNDEKKRENGRKNERGHTKYIVKT